MQKDHVFENKRSLLETDNTEKMQKRGMTMCRYYIIYSF